VTIKLDNLTAGYDRHPVVHHLSGSFADASMTAIVGPNGGGKSTLLKAMVGIVPLMTGTIEFGGVKTGEIAYLPQQFEIDRTFPVTVIEVVTFGHWSRTGALGFIRKSYKEEAFHALELVEMAAFANKPIVSLSTGQWQRVLFARIIVQRARFVLLDEPFAAIDAHTTLALMNLLEQWCRDGVTVISVMHDLDLVRTHFAYSLLLSRDPVAWGRSPETLCSKNLEAALDLAAGWHESSECCQISRGGVS